MSVPASVKALARGRAAFGDRAVVNGAGARLRPSGFRPSRWIASRIHETHNDELVGASHAERLRRDRIDPNWRAALMGAN